MYRTLFLLLSFFFISFRAAGQESLVRGMVKDAGTGETLIGANILLEEGRGTVTDFNGNFSIKLAQGSYNLQVSYVGYQTIKQEITVTDKVLNLEFRLESLVLDEVIIVADVARSRETPVAFSNVMPKKIEEELGGREIPMILNSTPGVYATQMGGGDGDARITIRGFDQRNVAVMIDGIPVNDMENGWVYWSNWFGLDQVTRSIQVQRGLSASKLALPSVGGTMNIITKGIENKRELNIKQELDAMGKSTTSLGYTSGLLPSGWGFTFAGSYKKGNGWVENTLSEGWFYYGKIDKRFDKHILTATAMGAPQKHQQRSYSRAIATYSLEEAQQNGIDIETTDANGDYLYRPDVNNMGIRYNQHWGYLKRDRFDENAPTEVLAGKVNEYHKPQFSIRDFWSISDRVSLSNIVYASIGKGGGNQPRYSLNETDLVTDQDSAWYGRINWQQIYNTNSKPTWTGFGWSYPISEKHSDSLYYSENYMTRQMNDHYWYGLLSTAIFRMNSNLTLSGGIDLRTYKGVHYQIVTDLLGGDYAIDKNDTRRDILDPKQEMKFVGDTVYYYNDGLVRWGGLFGQAEYKNERYSGFINLTTAWSGYKKIDYFEQTESVWKWKPGFTFKAGMNYNLTERSNIFINLGFLSKVRAYKYFYKGFSTDFVDDLSNEQVRAIEAGYHYGSPVLSANLNAYFTQWINKPTNRVYSTYFLQPGEPGYVPEDPESNEIRLYADIPGMDALHMGVELDFVWKILHNLEFQGLVSLGEWKWNKLVKNLQYYNSDNNEAVNMIIDFDARGIHVGDAAQTQLGSSLRYEPVKGLYLSARQTWFGKYFSNFSPEATTDGDGNVVDSWNIPAHNLFDVHTGYNFKIKNLDRLQFNLRFSMLNIFNTVYIADGTNNDGYSDIPYQGNTFDARSATVFYGMGRRFITSFAIKFY